jgi:hypothetical protein
MFSWGKVVTSQTNQYIYPHKSSGNFWQRADNWLVGQGKERVPEVKSELRLNTCPGKKLARSHLNQQAGYSGIHLWSQLHGSYREEDCGARPYTKNN